MLDRAEAPEDEGNHGFEAILLLSPLYSALTKITKQLFLSIKTAYHYQVHTKVGWNILIFLKITLLGVTCQGAQTHIIDYLNKQ